MVYFVCDTCGSCLKKNQVDSHWFKCRSNRQVSCMDCGKDFWGEEYAKHTQCISENQKYGGSNYVPKVNKGEQKQEEWIAKVREKVADTEMDPHLRRTLEKVMQFQNIPRKEAKFKNFMRSSVNVYNEQDIQVVWEIFKEANTKDDQKNNGMKNGHTETEHHKEVNKPKSDENCDAPCDSNTNSDDVKLNKRERKELRKEKQCKKSRKDKHVDRNSKNNKGKLDSMDTQQDIDATESKKKKKRQRDDDEVDEEEQRVDTAKPKKKKRKGETVTEEAEEIKPKKKKGKESDLLVIQEENVVIEKSKKKKKGKVDDDTINEEQNVQITKLKKKKKREMAQDQNGYGVNLLEHNTNHITEENEPQTPLKPGMFKWTSAIRKVLEQGPAEGMKLSKLQRKVFSLYYAAHGEDTKSSHELAVMMHKKIHKKNKFVVFRDKVRLQK